MTTVNKIGAMMTSIIRRLLGWIKARVGAALSGDRKRRIAACIAACAVLQRCFANRHRILAWLLLKIFRRVLFVPKGDFEEYAHLRRGKIDYVDEKNWAAYPGKHSSAELLPFRESRLPESERRADCFFVHPTGLFCGPGWNQTTIPNAQADEQTNSWMLTGQASAFNGTCRIFAPHYRQAVMTAYLADKVNGRKALDFAYGDVLAAFTHFLSVTGDRPIVLASHSQGGHHLQRLLEEVVDCDPALVRRLVCCYLVGSRIPLDKFQRSWKHLHEGMAEDDHSGAVVG